jgi:hypothetical protein
VSAVELGFDVFNGSYPMKLTQGSQALMFDYVYERKAEDSDEEEYEVSAKRRRVANDEASSVTEKSQTQLLIDLNDKK